MGANDIKLWQCPTGGSSLVRHFPMNNGEAFFEGEPVGVNDVGEVTESATQTIPADLMGIALGGPGGGRTNPATNANWATGDLVPVMIPNSTVTWITPNFAKASAAFDDTAPVVADIADRCGLVLINNVWGIDGAPDNNSNTCRIEDILNVRKESILVTGETVLTTQIFYIVFTIIAHMGTPDSAEAVGPQA